MHIECLDTRRLLIEVKQIYSVQRCRPIKDAYCQYMKVILDDNDEFNQRLNDKNKNVNDKYFETI